MAVTVSTQKYKLRGKKKKKKKKEGEEKKIVVAARTGTLNGEGASSDGSIICGGKKRKGRGKEKGGRGEKMGLNFGHTFTYALKSTLTQ